MKSFSWMAAMMISYSTDTIGSLKCKLTRYPVVLTDQGYLKDDVNNAGTSRA